MEGAMKKIEINTLLVPGIAVLLLVFGVVAAQAENKKSSHDAEYDVLEAQNGEKWAADDKVVDAKLAEFRARNGGKPPNILYILVD